MSSRERMSPIDTVLVAHGAADQSDDDRRRMMLEGPVDIPEARETDRRAVDRPSPLPPKGRSSLRRPPIGATIRQLRPLPPYSAGAAAGQRRVRPAFQRFVAELAGSRSIPTHPLWQVHIIEKYEGGAAGVFTRIHHAGRRRHRAYGRDDVARRGGDATPVKSLRRPRKRKAGCRPDGAGRRGGGHRGESLELHTAQVIDLVRNPQPRRRISAHRPRRRRRTRLSLVDAERQPDALQGQAARRQARGLERADARSEVKAVSRALGCSINDILLSCVAGAMRRYLVEKGDATDGVECRAMAPINMRRPGERRTRQLLRHHRRRTAGRHRGSAEAAR